MKLIAKISLRDMFPLCVFSRMAAWPNGTVNYTTFTMFPASTGIFFRQGYNPDDLAKKAQKYGDVFNLILGNSFAIELNEFDAVQEGVVVIHRVWIIRVRFQAGLPVRVGLRVLRVRFRLRPKQKAN